MPISIIFQYNHLSL